MNCTNKQQETAECEKRGCEGCFYNEKSADEIFKKLGYKITEENNSKNKYDNGIQFMKEERSTKKYIEFYYYHKQIVIYTDQYIYEKIKRWESTIIDMQELQAINKKVQELGWKG